MADKEPELKSMSRSEADGKGNPQSGESVTDHVSSAEFHGANTQRLSFRGWLVACAIIAALWIFVPGIVVPNLNLQEDPQFRVPYSLSEDYSLFRNYASQVRETPDSEALDLVMLGDSVIWGEYVAKENSWPAELTQIWNASVNGSGNERAIRIWNFGLNGAHPTALRGLIRLHGDWGRSTPMIIHFNPLWMTSPERDLSTDKPAPFNHPALAPQFSERPKVYKEELGERLRVAVGQRAGFLLWAQGMRIRHLDGYDWSGWAMENPRSTPLDAEFVQKSDDLWKDDGIREGVEAISWEARRIPKQSFSWVDPADSYQWAQFQRLMDELREQGRKFLVVLGPLNTWVMKDTELPIYQNLLDQVESVLKEKSIPCWRPDPVTSEFYADTSHPIAKGYAELAEQSLSSEVWKNWITELQP